MKETVKDYITRRVPSAEPGALVGHVLEKLKREDYDYCHHVFVTDRSMRIKGCVELTALLKHAPSARIETLLTPCPSISIGRSLEFAANHAISQGMQAVPVVDSAGAFMGILPPQAIIETLRNEHIEDMHKIAGIRRESRNASHAIKEPPIRSVWHRLPWLCAGLIGSFIATFIMSRYEDVLNRNISLAFFLPGIVYLADAIGTQTETIVIRGLSLSWVAFKKMLIREFLTGLTIGLILGVLSVPAAFAAGYDIRMAVVVAASILVAGALATTIGLLLPWLLQRFGKDPAFGSGPLATIIQDVLSILVYLLIAKTVLEAI